MKFFSVVIPSYNRALYLSSTINTVLNQSFKDFELIVVDDGSTDNTRSVVESFRDSRIRYFYKENGERGAARNYGFAKSVSKYVLFLDSDDELIHNHLSTLYKYLSNYQEDFICTKYLLRREGGQLRSSDLNALESGYYDYKIFLRGNPLGCNICVRRENIELISFREERKFASMEDWIFIIENLSNNKIRLLDETTLIMNDHSGRSMRANNKNIIECRKEATLYLEEQGNFKKPELSTIKGYSAYFCAVHFYLDENRKEGFRELLKSIQYNGFNIRFLILFLKLIVGKEWIEYLRKKAGQGF